MVARRIRFRQFELDRIAHELRRDGEAVDLPVSAFDCLAFLIEHRERPVGRDELILAVWSRPNVSETLLGQTIARLRRELGDTGSEQHSIRTVARKGYRWVAPVIEVDTADAAGPSQHASPTPASVFETPARPSPTPTSAQVDTEAQVDVAPGVCPPSPITDPAVHAATPKMNPMPPGAHPGLAVALSTRVGPASARVRAWVPGRRALAAIGTAACLLIGIAAWLFWGRESPQPGVPRSAPEPAQAAALVLPVEVAAGSEWAWLRLGLMDLVAGHLRQGGQPTITSESVVGLVQSLATTPGTPINLDAPELQRVSALRVQPRLSLLAGEWRAQLEVRHHGRSLQVEARADDALVAGRRAADLLLVKLGKEAPQTSSVEQPRAIEDIVQRAKAATLAGQLELARTVLGDAPPELRGHPELIWSAALIEASSGQYEASVKRLTEALPRVSGSTEPVLRARMLTLLGAMHTRRAQAEAARAAYDEAIQLAAASNAQDVVAHAYAGRAVVHALRHEYDQALADFGRARVLSAAVGNVLRSAQIDLNVGGITLVRGQPAAALNLLRDAAQRLQALSAQEEWAVALLGAADAQLRLLDHVGALKTLDAVQPLETTVANARLRWSLTLVQAKALAAGGQLDAAETLAREIKQQAAAPIDALFHAGASATLALIATQRGDASTALREARAALHEGLQRNDVLSYLNAWQILVASLHELGETEQAAVETRQFVAWLSELSLERSPGLVDFALAEQARAEQRTEAALDAYRLAFSTIERSAAPDEVVLVGTRYASLLIEQQALDAAASVVGRAAAWGPLDPRVTRVQAQLARALPPIADPAGAIASPLRP